MLQHAAVRRTARRSGPEAADLSPLGHTLGWDKSLNRDVWYVVELYRRNRPYSGPATIVRVRPSRRNIEGAFSG